jgi:uncharacterized SAM-binding protein YcdF (DUF218 family)
MALISTNNNSCSRRQFFRKATLIAALFALCDLAATVFFIRSGVPLFADQPGGTWEAAVVLFSDFGPYGGIDEESLRRLNFVLDLYRKGRVPLVICSGGARPSRNAHGSALMKRYLIEQGVEDTQVIEETRSNNSLGNLWETRNILQQLQVSRAVVVSSPIHLPRLKGLTSKFTTPVIFDTIAYDLQQGDPPIAWYTVYQQIHHEFAASLASAIFSEDLLVRLINLIRD